MEMSDVATAKFKEKFEDKDRHHINIVLARWLWHRTAVAICCDLSSPTGGWDGSGKVGREGFFLPPPGMSLCQKDHPYRGHTVNLDLYLSVLELPASTICSCLPEASNIYQR